MVATGRGCACAHHRGDPRTLCNSHQILAYGGGSIGIGASAALLAVLLPHGCVHTASAAATNGMPLMGRQCLAGTVFTGGACIQHANVHGQPLWWLGRSLTQSARGAIADALCRADDVARLNVAWQLMRSKRAVPMQREHRWQPVTAYTVALAAASAPVAASRCRDGHCSRCTRRAWLLAIAVMMFMLTCR